MKQEVKPEPQARESSFVNLLSGWVQQGVENFFATQRILVDLAMRQNGTIIDVLREKLTAPDFQPVAVAKEFAGEGIANFIEGQKLLLELAQHESEILAEGLKQRVGGFAVTDALLNTIHRSMAVYVEMQMHYLKAAGKQVHERLNAVKAGEEYEGDTLVELARGGLEDFVQAQKQYLHIVAEEASRLTGGKETTISKAKKTELTRLAQEAADTFIEAQKKLMDVAARQIHASLKAAGTAAKMVPSVPYREIPDLTREGFRSFVEAEKAVIESVTRRPEAKKTAAKPTARKRPRAAKPRVIPVNA
ncbi:MAG TPA: hypothetical protein VE779_08465 [Candidatus Angelobacter sp.]|jgi:hypothetical protein|nr:hypothetical protein [Candidatus Angelobacter sp.]